MAGSSRGSHYALNEELQPAGEPRVQFDNGGRHSLLVPGFGYPIPIELPIQERFAHGFNDWSQHRLTAREIAMLHFMNIITDRPRWYLDVHDASTITAWEAAALAVP